MNNIFKRLMIKSFFSKMEKAQEAKLAAIKITLDYFNNLCVIVLLDEINPRKEYRIEDDLNTSEVGQLVEKHLSKAKDIKELKAIKFEAHRTEEGFFTTYEIYYVNNSGTRVMNNGNEYL